MALNIPMPDLPGTAFLKGADTGSSMFSRMIQPVIERERMKQQQDQFVQNLALQKQAQGRAAALMPYMIQQYKDAHRTAASEAEMKEMYRNLIKNALSGDDSAGAVGGAPPPVAPGMPPQAMGGQPNPMQQGGMPQQGMPPQGMPQQGMPQNVAPPVPGAAGAPPMPGMPPNAPTPPVTSAGVVPQGASMQEHELRPGNPRLAKLDQIAGLVPGVPKPVQHISGGMVFTTYPSGRMTVQQVSGSGGQTPGERNVSAKEASKIRDQATALINSANLVNEGYGILDNNEDLTGLGSGLASKFNLSNNPELGKFTSVTGKLQAELGKYASSRGGIQAVNWAAGVKPSQWKPQEYNYGMFEGIEKNLKDDYSTLNAQYKAATGQDLPVPLPQMTTKKQRPGSAGGSSGQSGGNGKGKVTKWKMTGGQLVKE